MLGTAAARAARETHFSQQNDGRLRLSRQGIIFKNSKTGKVDNIQAGELTEGIWRRVALGHGLKLLTKNGHVYKYDGFRESVRHLKAVPLRPLSSVLVELEFLFMALSLGRVVEVPEQPLVQLLVFCSLRSFSCEGVIRSPSHFGWKGWFRLLLALLLGISPVLFLQGWCFHFELHDLQT